MIISRSFHFDFVDLTYHAQELSSPYRVFFSQALYDLCQRCSNTENDRAADVVAVATANIQADMPFPTFLWGHDFCPYVASVPGEDGFLQLCLMLPKEAVTDAQSFFEYCLYTCKFHEFSPVGRKKDPRLRVFFSRSLKAMCKRASPTPTGYAIDQAFDCLAHFFDRTDQSPSWHFIWGVSACAYRLIDDDGASRVYFMSDDEWPPPPKKEEPHGIPF